MTDPLAVLRRAAAALADHPDADVREVVAPYLASGARGDVGDWFDIQNRAGRPWRRELGPRERNRILRDAARMLPAGLTLAEQARRLAKALAVYHDTGWRAACAEQDCPHPPDHLHAVFWRALMAYDVPVGERQMERIMG